MPVSINAWAWAKFALQNLLAMTAACTACSMLKRAGVIFVTNIKISSYQKKNTAERKVYPNIEDQQRKDQKDTKLSTVKERHSFANTLNILWRDLIFITKLLRDGWNATFHGI